MYDPMYFNQNVQPVKDLNVNPLAMGAQARNVNMQFWNRIDAYAMPRASGYYQLVDSKNTPVILPGNSYVVAVGAKSNGSLLNGVNIGVYTSSTIAGVPVDELLPPTATATLNDTGIIAEPTTKLPGSIYRYLIISSTGTYTQGTASVSIFYVTL